MIKILGPMHCSGKDNFLEGKIKTVPLKKCSHDKCFMQYRSHAISKQYHHAQDRKTMVNKTHTHT